MVLLYTVAHGAAAAVMIIYGIRESFPDLCLFYLMIIVKLIYFSFYFFAFCFYCGKLNCIYLFLELALVLFLFSVFPV